VYNSRVTNDSNKNNHAVETLRILAIAAIVLIHTTTKTIQASNNNLALFSFSLFLNQVARFAVPMFFAISGFVMEKNYTGEIKFFTYFKKRIIKVIPPYIFWTVFYYYLIFPDNHTSVFTDLLSGNASYQLYFIPAILILYLFFPIFHKYYIFLANKYTLTFIGIVELLLLTRDYYLSPFKIYYPLSVALLNVFIFIIGMFSANNELKIISMVRKNTKLIFITVMLLAIGIFIEGKDRYLATYNYLTFYSQWRPTILVYSILFSGLAYYLIKEVNLNQRLLKVFIGRTFFIYFVHVAVLSLFWKTIGSYIYGLLSPYFLGRIVFDPLLFLIVFFISFLSAYLVSRIPILSKITG
jgi:probable poly-beta-1,6-N-acetyl-D-glucosamine export protein